MNFYQKKLDRNDDSKYDIFHIYQYLKKNIFKFLFYIILIKSIVNQKNRIAVLQQKNNNNYY